MQKQMRRKPNKCGRSAAWLHKDGVKTTKSKNKNTPHHYVWTCPMRLPAAVIALRDADGPDVLPSGHAAVRECLSTSSSIATRASDSFIPRSTQ